jgi:hypothetical protein
VTATVVVNRGKTMRADASQVVTVQPTVLVQLAETAQLESGGGAVVLDVTVACPAGTNGLVSSLVVWQGGQAIGTGTYVPICDGSRHTFTVRAEASNGVYQAGIGQAVTFANIEYAGENFYGIDDDGALDIMSWAGGGRRGRQCGRHGLSRWRGRRVSQTSPSLRPKGENRGLEEITPANQPLLGGRNGCHAFVAG